MNAWIESIMKMAYKTPLPIISYPAARRLGISIADMTEKPLVQAEAMLYVADQLGTPALMTSMDLALEASCFGAAVDHSGVPAVKKPILPEIEDAEKLEIPSEAQIRDKSPYLEAIRLVKEKMAANGDTRPVIAGISGPFSLAGQLRGMTDIMMDCYDEPDLLAALTEKLTVFLSLYAKMLKEAGADGLLIAEPLAGVISPSMAGEFSHPYVKSLIDGVQDESFAVIYHNCGAGVMRMLPDLADLGAKAYHFGNAVSMEEILPQMPQDVLIMGNIDPAGIMAHGSREAVRKAVDDLQQRCMAYNNFWLSTGCDVPPDAPWENLQEFMHC